MLYKCLTSTDLSAFEKSTAEIELENEVQLKSLETAAQLWTKITESIQKFPELNLKATELTAAVVATRQSFEAEMKIRRDLLNDFRAASKKLCNSVQSSTAEIVKKRRRLSEVLHSSQSQGSQASQHTQEEVESPRDAEPPREEGQDQWILQQNLKQDA